MKRTIKTSVKTSTNNLVTLGLAGCAAIISPLAMADNTTDFNGWYMGANIGSARAKIDNARITSNLLGAGFTTTGISNDDRATGYKLFAGYQMSRNFAVEGGYFDLGEYGFVATTAVPNAGTLSGNIKLRGINLDLLGIMPVSDKFSVFGRVGVNYAQARDTFSSTGLVPPPANPNPSKREANYKYGFGLQYDFTEALGMRAEAERYRINDAVGNRGDITMASLGLVYRFGATPPPPPPRPAPQPVAAAPVYVAPPPPPPTPTPPPAPVRVTLEADSLFDFNKATIKSAGQQHLDKFAADLKVRGTQYDVITVTGHTDRIGSEDYNMRLSTHRAEAGKAYLVETAGIPASKIVAVGKGESEPVTKPGECVGAKSPRLIACLMQDRRIEVEVTVTRPAK